MAENGPIEIGLRVDAQQATRQIEDFSKRSRVALKDVSLVIQDLPFGFIGIQNNLPALTQSFGELVKTSNGVKGALSQLGSSLLGAGGLYLAFSAVTAAATFAIQEYGSLTNAAKVLFGANENLVKSQNDFNKALVSAGGGTASQVAKINILVKAIQDENTTQEDRISYYRQLKKINPDVVAGIDEQNLATARSIKLIGENSKAQLEFLKLQTKAAAISKAIEGLEEKRFEANGKYNAARQDQINLEKRLAAIDQKKSSKIALTAQERTLDAQRELVKLDYANSVKEASGEIADITKQQENWYNSLEPTVLGISKISSAAQNLTNDLKDLRKSEDDSAKSAAKLNEERKKQFELLGDIRSLRNQDFLDFDPTLKPIKKVDPKGYIESFTKSLKELPGANVDPLIDVLFPEDQFKALSDIWGKINKDTAPKLEEFKNQIRDALISKELSTGVKTTYDDVEKAISDAITRLQQLIASDASITQNFQDAINKGANEFEKLKEQAKGFDELKSTIESNLTRPFRDFFDDLLTNGKMSFDSFAELAKDALKRIAAQLIATGLAQLLANILNPAGAAASAAVASSKGGGIFEIFKNILGIKSVASPSFGGVGGGPMQMAGAVNLTLRGSDLVASINRTNSTINRIG
jgi:hypothetical protein